MKVNIVLLACCLGSIFCLVRCDDDEEDYNYVLNECNHKLRHIDSIAKFETFMLRYKALDKTKKRPKRGFLKTDSRLKKCYELEEPLLELEKIVVARRDYHVCQLEYVEQLIEFHLNHLIKNDKSSDSQDPGDHKTTKSLDKTKLSYLAYFFSLYAHQVAYNCKSNLTKRVQQAQDHNDCLPVLFTFMPSIFEPTNSEDQDGEDLTEAENFLREFRRVESFAPILKFKHSPKISDAYFDAVIPEAAIEKIESLKRECRAREPYYTALFAPIATLAHLGYSVEESTSDSSDMNNSDTRLLKCWLATAQLCQGILRTHLTVKEDFEPVDNSKFVSIKWNSVLSNNQGEVFKKDISDEIDMTETVDEITAPIVELVKKQFTGMGKMKKKALSWAKGFIERRINLDAIQRDASKNFLDALTSVENGVDSKVAFNGKQFDKKKFNPVSVITDDADMAVQLSSPLWNKEVGLLVSSVIAITMSAVFVWFSLYAIASTLKQQYFSTDVNPNSKAEWRKIRDDRIRTMENKLKGKKATDFGKVYKPL